jgi:hypothetical protein
MGWLTLAEIKPIGIDYETKGNRNNIFSWK